MKREILCEKCADMTNLPTFPEEHWKFISGKAKSNFKCDADDCEIKPGQIAVAMSIWADYGGIPYYPWETEYLDGSLSLLKASKSLTGK